MSPLDWILGIILALAAFQGLRKGFIMELATLLGLIVGVYAGIHFSGLAAGLIRDTFHYEGRLLPVISFAVVFILVLLGIFFLGKILEKSAEILMVGWLNKLLGAIFGLIKQTLILSFILLILNSFSSQGHILPKSWREDSVLYTPVSSFAVMLMPRLKTLHEKEDKKAGDADLVI